MKKSMMNYDEFWGLLEMNNKVFEDIKIFKLLL